MNPDVNFDVMSSVTSLRDFKDAYVTPFVDYLRRMFRDVNYTDRSNFRELIKRSDNLDNAVDYCSSVFGESSGFRKLADKMIANELFDQPIANYDFVFDKHSDSYQYYTHKMIDDCIDRSLERVNRSISFEPFDELVIANPNRTTQFIASAPDYVESNNATYPAFFDMSLGNSFIDVRGERWQPVMTNILLDKDYGYEGLLLMVPMNDGQIDVANSQVASERFYCLDDSQYDAVDANMAASRFRLGNFSREAAFDSSGHCVHCPELIVSDFESQIGDMFYSNSCLKTLDKVDTFDWDKLSEYVTSVSPVGDVAEPAASAADVRPDLQSTDDTLGPNSEGYDITES